MFEVWTRPSSVSISSLRQGHCTSCYTLYNTFKHRWNSFLRLGSPWMTSRYCYWDQVNSRCLYFSPPKYVRELICLYIVQCTASGNLGDGVLLLLKMVCVDTLEMKFIRCRLKRSTESRRPQRLNTSVWSPFKLFNTKKLLFWTFRRDIRIIEKRETNRDREACEEEYTTKCDNGTKTNQRHTSETHPAKENARGVRRRRRKKI